MAHPQYGILLSDKKETVGTQVKLYGSQWNYTVKKTIDKDYIQHESVHKILFRVQNYNR